MDLSHEFEIPLSIDEAWAVLTDLERIAPCMPGAQLDEIEGDEYRGKVRVKVGPVTVEYKGTATFLERVPETHTAVLRAAGRETKGQGNAAATVTATLESADATRTKVSVVTALDISGRVAQFGRGALADVSSKIMSQFVENLERDLTAGLAVPDAANAAAGVGGATADVPAPSAEAPEAVADTVEIATGGATADSEAPTIRKINSAPVEPVRLGNMVSSTLLRRLSPIALVGLVAVLFRRLRHRHRA